MHLRFTIQRHAAAVKRLPDRMEQFSVLKWLEQKFHGACLHRLDRHGYVTVARNKNNRHAGPVQSNTLLQIKAICVRQRNIEYEAVWSGRPGSGKKVTCARKYLRLPTFTAKQ